MEHQHLDQFSYSTLPLNDIFDSMNEGVIIYDHEGKVFLFNTASLNILGVSENALSEISWFEKRTLNEDMSPVTSKSYPSVIAKETGEPQIGHIYAILQEDKSLKWVSVNAVPIFDEKHEKVVNVVVTFIDVTEEKKYQEKLKHIQKKLERNESFLINVLDALPVLVCYVDRNLVYRYANHAYEKFVKVKREELLGKTVPDILGPEVYNDITPMIEKVFDGELQHFEDKVDFPGLGERSTSVIFAPDIDDEGVKGCIAIIDDITEIVSAMEKIKQNEEEQSRVLDSINAYIGHWSKDLINIHSNREYAEFFHRSPTSVKGMHIKDLYGPALYEESRPYIERVLKGESQTYEREIIDPKGNKNYIMVTYLPEIKKGEIVGYFFIGNDVTKLKNSEAKFKAVLELSPNPNLILNDNGHIELVNNQTIVQFGYNKEELIGMPFKQLVPERLISSAEKIFESYIKSPSITTIGKKFELWAKRKDGSEFPFELSIGPFQTEGHVLFKCVIQDISERLRQTTEREELLDKELKARIEAEEATEKRDEMLAIVSHDLRNPLSIIVGNIEFLMKKRSQDSELITKLEKMKHYSNMMLTMIQDLLDVYKMEEGKFDIESGKAVHVTNTVVRDICIAQEILVNKNGLTLQIDFEDDLPNLSFDLTLINRVFQNLISNSLKFTPPGGTIKVTAKKTESSVVFSVEDTGPGIEENVLSDIFDRFVQAKKTSHLGAGLGLPICKAIVEAHGGHIWIETEPGVGSKFFFSIPNPKNIDLNLFH